MESEHYFDPVLNQVAVNVTDVYDADLRKLLAELGEEFSWAGVEFQTIACGNDVSQWMMLHEATIVEDEGCRGERRGTGR